MNKNKVFGIIKFNIARNLQDKWFVILNVFLLVICLISTNLDNISNLLESHNIHLFNKEMIVEILDKDGIARDKFEMAFEENEKVEIKYIEANNYTEDTIGDNTVVVEIEENDKDIVVGKIVSKDAVPYDISEPIIETFEEIRAELFAEINNIELEELEIMNASVNVEEVMLAVDADNYAKKEFIKLISVVLIDFICIFVFSKIANEVAEEKVSRSIEYVLTSVTAKEYLFAKIASIISVILMQMVYVAVYYFVGVTLNGIISPAILNTDTASSTFASLDIEIVLYIITVFVYGVLTLILMSIIQAAISSKTTSMTEAGNTTLLLTTITMVSYFVTLLLITPYTNMTPFIYIISCIPLLSNFFVPTIMIIGQATKMQIIVSLLLLTVSIPIAFEICSKIFKNGVLDYTNKKMKNNKMNKVERTIKEEQEYRVKISKYKNYSFVLGLTMMLFVVLQLIIHLLSYTLVLPTITHWFSDTQLELIATSIISIFSMYLSYKFVRLYTENTEAKSENKISIKEKIRITLVGTFVFAVVQVALPYILEFIGVNYTMTSILGFEPDGTLLTNILLFVALAIVPAVFEELLFRKAIIDFSKNFGNVFAIVISAFIFGIIHMNFAQGILAFVVGLLMGYIYLKTGDIRITMLLHLLNNAYSTFQLMLGEDAFGIKIINIIYLIPIGMGAVASILKSLREVIKAFKLKDEDDGVEELNNKFVVIKEKLVDYKYIFCNYTFVVSMLLIIIEFIAVEKMLRGM